MQKDLIIFHSGNLEQKYKNILESNLNLGIKLLYGDDLPDEFDILIDGTPSQIVLSANKSLKNLIIPYAGVPKVTQTLMQEYPNIQVFNLHHNSIAVAEFTLALLLACIKNIVNLHNSLLKNDWRLRYQSNSGGMLTNKRALVLGYGAIGKEVSRLLNSFGVEVTALKKNLKDNNIKSEKIDIRKIEDLHHLLPQTDFLIIALPLTVETETLISKHELDLLPSSAYVINIGRGAIIDQEALFNSLKSKSIAGAGIDVWYNYPSSENERDNTSPSKFPFHKLDNIIMTPHKAGGLASGDVEALRMQELATLLNKIKGNEFVQPVDINAGY